MNVFNLSEIFNKLESFFYKIYKTEECRVCNNKIKCQTDQFLHQEKNHYKCNSCNRKLESIRNKS